MPLNEDALRKVFEKWFRPERPLLRDENGDYIYMAAHSAWLTFKAAYSPKVLQALGVAVVPTVPTQEMEDAAAEAYMPFGDMHIALLAGIAASGNAIKEQS